MLAELIDLLDRFNFLLPVTDYQPTVNKFTTEAVGALSIENIAILQIDETVGAPKYSSNHM